MITIIVLKETQSPSPFTQSQWPCFAITLFQITMQYKGDLLQVPQRGTIDLTTILLNQTHLP